MLLEIEDKIHDKTCNGKCSRCGQCCDLFIPITKQEIKVIKEYVTKHNIKPTQRINILNNDMKAVCCFYNEKEHKCNIYNVRPYVCSHFMCNDKNWRDNRHTYCQRSDYNGGIDKPGFIAATFDDLIYEDYTYIIQYFLQLALEISPNKQLDSKCIIQIFRHFNRLDLLKYFSAIDENGNKVEGVDMLKEE